MEEKLKHAKETGEMIAELKNINATMLRIEVNLEGQEKRIRVLENWRYWLAGSILVGTVAPQFVRAFL